MSAERSTAGGSLVSTVKYRLIVVTVTQDPSYNLNTFMQVRHSLLTQEVLDARPGCSSSMVLTLSLDMENVFKNSTSEMEVLFIFLLF